MRAASACCRMASSPRPTGRDAGGGSAESCPMPVLALDDIALNYVDAGQGAPVVLVHGLACGWRLWRSQIRALAPRCRVVAYDQRGHGRSTAPADPAAYSEE